MFNVNDETWTNIWLEKRLWDTPPDTEADVRRTSEWQEARQRHPSNQPEPVHHPKVGRFNTSIDSQAMVTVDNQIGLWIKVTPEVYERWSDRAATIQCEPDIPLDNMEDWALYQDAHNWAMHEVSDDWASWFVTVMMLADELGWEA